MPFYEVLILYFSCTTIHCHALLFKKHIIFNQLTIQNNYFYFHYYSSSLPSLVERVVFSEAPT